MTNITKIMSVILGRNSNASYENEEICCDAFSNSTSNEKSDATFDMISEVISSDTSTNIPNEILNNFENYCYNKDYDNIEKYLKKYQNLSFYDNGFYFEIIADTGNLKLIKLFLENGARLDVDDYYVMYTCCEHGYWDCVDYLMNKYKDSIDVSSLKNTCGYYNYLQREKINTHQHVPSFVH
jgi:hypothetical protein